MMLREKRTLASLLPLKESIEKELAKAVQTLGEKTKLRDACEYALTNGGKRFRPMIVLMIGEALSASNSLIPAALAVEFFHTASLIADDLPCMDNDDERRNKPSLHKIYEESVAILASYTLISLGYAYIHKNVEEMARSPSNAAKSDAACSIALNTVSHLAGIFGATNGQFLDLFPPDQSLKTLQKIIYQKTVTLFEISFVLGWVFAGGSPALMPDVKACALHLGMAFQIGDDLQDMLQDGDHENASNIACQLGIEIAVPLFCQEISSFKEKLQKLGLYTEGFKTLIYLLADLVQKSLDGAPYAKEQAAVQEIFSLL